MIEIHPLGYSGNMDELVGRIAMAEAGLIWLAARNPVRVEKVTKQSIQGTEVPCRWDMDLKTYVPGGPTDHRGSVTFRATSIRAVCDAPEEVCAIINMTETNASLFKAFKQQAAANLKTLTNRN